MKYVIRDVIDLLSMPLMLMFGMLLIALLLRWRGHLRASLATAASGLALLYVCALEPVSSALLEPLESSHPVLDDAHLPQGIAGIAVLGGYFAPRPDTPITAQLPGATLECAAEGVRLAKRYGNVRLVLSGGVPPGPGTPSAHGYAIFARAMGIDPASIVVLDRPATTSEEARALAKLFGSSPFLLVTSASHMKRAMMLFDGTGAHPIPAPTGQRASRAGFVSGLMPRSGNLQNTQMALHEYLGILAISAGQG
jgi:uncharacterized SAM-binding protein YcdF (DUF218 family)